MNICSTCPLCGGPVERTTWQRSVYTWTRVTCPVDGTTLTYITDPDGTIRTYEVKSPSVAAPAAMTPVAVYLDHTTAPGRAPARIRYVRPVRKAA